MTTVQVRRRVRDAPLHVHKPNFNRAGGNALSASAFHSAIARRSLAALQLAQWVRPARTARVSGCSGPETRSRMSSSSASWSRAAADHLPPAPAFSSSSVPTRPPAPMKSQARKGSPQTVHRSLLGQVLWKLCAVFVIKDLGERWHKWLGTLSAVKDHSPTTATSSCELGLSP